MNTELVEYTTATKMAGVYKSSTKRILSLLLEVAEECGKLQEAFSDQYGFSVDVYFDGERHNIDEKDIERLAEHFRRTAWSAIIGKLEIRKLMSCKRAARLDAQLDGRCCSSEDESVPLPEIDETTIVEVLTGMMSSADEFLQEAIHEEYEFWKSSKQFDPYKRNSEFTLNHRIIRSGMVERLSWSANGNWRPNYHRTQHLTALDNIFHLLDGKGFAKGYRGELVAAIETSHDGTGRTEYFAFRCHKNSNIHLEFLRPDLLEQFNRIAGRNRLPSE